MSRHTTPKLSKKKKRQIEQQRTQEMAHLKNNFNICNVQPLTETQGEVWEAFYTDANLMMHGYAGTGKSFIAIYLALRELLEDDVYDKIIIVRSVVPSRDMGYLPGSINEKIKVYEDPYRHIFQELFGRADAYDQFKAGNAVEFISTSFVRGTTFNDCIVIVDEMQNMDWGELSSVITRVGENSKIIFCGDVMQSDFRFRERFNKDDIIDFMEVIKKMPQFKMIEFGIRDIVRSALVKNFIIESTKLGRNIA